jgi:TPR repeat protein
MRDRQRAADCATKEVSMSNSVPGSNAREDGLATAQTPSRVLLMIYSAMATVLLVVGGVIQGSQYLWPETPMEKFARAVEALDSGDNAIAYHLFKKLAANGNPAAEYWLADISEFGLGIEQNIPEAVTLLQSSADQGFVPAQLRLGELYLSGTDLDPDYAKAKDMLSKAAARRNAKAQRLLGQMYAQGTGVPRDPVSALIYFTAAAANGDRLAIPELQKLQAQTPGAQQSQAMVEARKRGLVE